MNTRLPDLIVCPSEMHANALVAELKSADILYVIWDSRRVIVEKDITDAFDALLIRHCAFRAGWSHGACVMENDQLDWFYVFLN